MILRMYDDVNFLSLNYKRPEIYLGFKTAIENKEIELAITHLKSLRDEIVIRDTSQSAIDHYFINSLIQHIKEDEKNGIFK